MGERARGTFLIKSVWTDLEICGIIKPKNISPLHHRSGGKQPSFPRAAEGFLALRLFFWAETSGRLVIILGALREIIQQERSPKVRLARYLQARPTAKERQYVHHQVAASSRSTAVAGAIAGMCREHGRAELRAIGVSAVNQAMKAVVIARGYLALDGMDVICIPSFVAYP